MNFYFAQSLLVFFQGKLGAKILNKHLFIFKVFHYAEFIILCLKNLFN